MEARVELLPRAMVVGGFGLPPEMRVGDKVPVDRYMKIFAALLEAGYSYQASNMLPDGAGIQISSPPRGDDAVIISPPLIQVTTPLSELSAEAGALKAENIVKIAARILGVSEIANLGIRTIYDAPLPSNDAKDFILNRVLSHGGEHLDELRLGGDLWGGVKYVATSADGLTSYTVQIEPAVASQMKSLFVDVDAQFQGGLRPDDIHNRASDVGHFVTSSLISYLNRLIDPS